jgi:hypothetical protein
MPRRTSYAQQDPGTPAGRIEFLLRVLWSGSQRKMSQDLSVSQALISKVVRGERAPGSKLLDAVANHPRVNRLWLHEGQGEPLRAEHHEAPADEYWVPIARLILPPGPPADHEGLLAGPRLPVAAFYYRSSRYLLEIGADDAVVRVSELKIAPGDMLLLETDSATWQGDVRVLNDRLCAVRGEAGDRRQHLLAKASVNPRKGTLSFDLYGHDEGTNNFFLKKRGVRSVDTVERDTGRSQSADDLPETPPLDSVRPDDPIGAAPVEERPSTAQGQGQGPKPSGETIESCRPGAADAERVMAFCVLLLRR